MAIVGAFTLLGNAPQPKRYQTHIFSAGLA